MERKPARSKQTLAYPLLCRVCGDIARGINFSAASCMSCKMFFRRHAESLSFEQQCYFNGNCNITLRTRKFCTFCRLKRCFKVGMDPQLIRHSQCQIRNIQLSKPTTLSLLNKDRSTLTANEWNLLSNIINSYDEQNLVIKTKDFFSNQFSLPPKFRSKDPNLLNYVGSVLSTLYTFIERCPLFYSLPLNIRKVLIKRNLSAIGSYNGLFIGKETKLMENAMCSKSIGNIYGHDHVSKAIEATQRLEQNGTLNKIMLMLMMFSNNCTIVSIDLAEDNHIILNPRILLHIENTVVRMLWKYLIYQYGFKESVLKYASLVKSILDIIKGMADGLNVQRHWTLVENVVEQKTRLLSLEDDALKE